MKTMNPSLLFRCHFIVTLAALINAPATGAAIEYPANATANQSNGGGTLYVSPNGSHVSPFATWQTASITIQDALDVASDGDTVLVTNGTYVLSTQISITTGITVASVNGAEFTTVDGDGSTRCVMLSNSSAVVDGFTITGGAATDGGGVSILDGTAQNCTITDNSANGLFGGGVGGGVVSISVGGGVSMSGGMVQNCTISGNSADRNPILFGPLLNGGGVSMSGGTVQNCAISGNSADHGGGVYCDGGGTVQNCAISGNSAAFSGGGVYCLRGGTVQNCAISGNSASSDGGHGVGGGVVCVSDGMIENCTIYFNTAVAGDPNWSLSHGSYAYCCTTPLVPGAGNFVAAPLLTPDLRLRAVSPCIDAGSAANAPPADMDGEARWDHPDHPNVGSIVDVGADEFIDTDGDALADAWESAHAGNLGWDEATDNDVSGGSDGLSALEEYHEGTDPNKSDTDDDLLIDGQEIVHGTDPLAPDTDGDAQRDGEEVIAGTNPLNAAEYFSFQQMVIDPGISAPVISWQSVTGRLYTLSVSADLINEVWASVSGYENLPGTGAEVAYTNPVPQATELYRVQVRLADVPSRENFDLLYLLFEASGPRFVSASFDSDGTFEDSAGNTGLWFFQPSERRLVFVNVGSARSALFFGSESSNGVLIGLKMCFPELKLSRWFGGVINGALNGAR
jgi:hypothetical protein